MSCADVGPSCPAGASPIERRGEVQDMVIHCNKVDEELNEMEENLQCLTVGIKENSIDDLPRHYQC